MVKKTITYTDFNDNEVTETFSFNLTTEELVRYQLKYGGNFTQRMNTLMENKDIAGIIEMINELIRMSYGKLLPNGDFIKNKEIIDAFVSTDAYSQLVLDLYNDLSNLNEFIIACCPKKARELFAQQANETPAAEDTPAKVVPAAGNLIEMN